MKIQKNFDFEPVWFDSMGAKSTCCFLKTPDTSICIDPGVAVMQPSYPLPDLLKKWYKFKAERRIKKACERAEIIAISHYHYDHHTLDSDLYRGKELWIKNPNKWINNSQWERSRKFLKLLAGAKGKELKEIKPKKKEFKDPYDSLEIAKNKDFGDYQERREELLEKWRKRFEKLADRWSSEKWIEEPEFVNYADGKEIEKGDTKIKFRRPFFHGIEYAKTGWVLPTVVEYKGKKFLHSSDLQGPTIEDHAEWIIEEDPDVLFVDGPATYLYGYLLNKTNLKRSVNNAARILKELNPELMVYDHHLLRERKYKERTEKLWELKEKGFNIKTAAELKGEKPLIDRCKNWSDEEIEDKKEKARKEITSL